ncbi:MAG: hypothetical protein V7K35_10740 [Nostoc sp.]|uniref:hypothetical protein n=1 Tax=Nostoc sp. TaxID=1180 RepID=UPI002FF9D6A9
MAIITGSCYWLTSSRFFDRRQNSPAWRSLAVICGEVKSKKKAAGKKHKIDILTTQH